MVNREKFDEGKNEIILSNSIIKIST